MTTERKWRRRSLAAIAAGVALTLTAAAVFQDNIVRFFATPRAPFQTVEAPPAPDYAAPESWLSFPGPTEAAKPADLFYIHSTAFYRRKLWNAPFDDEEADKIRLTVAAPNEAGPFTGIARVFAPRYREATLYSLFTHKYDGLAARQLAYRDVKKAFETFLAARDPETPIVIAGYGQGGLYALGLLNDYFQGEYNSLRGRLVAAYVIDASTPEGFLSALSPPVPVCGGPSHVRCVVSYTDFEPRFNEEMDRVRNRALMWSPDSGLVSEKREDIVCVNPLSWTTGDEYQQPEKNRGAASATGLGLGALPPAMSAAVGAQCVRGILVVDTPKKRYLRRGNWLGAKWKAQPFNLFYYDLAENAEARLAALQEIMKTEPVPLEPIGETVDVIDSPINQAPN